MTRTPSVLDLSLSQRTVARIVLLAAAGSAAALASTAFVRLGRDTFGKSAWWSIVAPQISLVGERSIAAWYASLMLLLVAGAFVLCHLAEQRGDGRRRWGWLVVAAGFAALSLDEAGSVHERTTALRSLNLLGGAAHTWVGVLAVPFLVCVGGFAVFSWRRLRSRPLVFALLCVGTLLFASILLYEEVEVRDWISRAAEAGGDGESRRRALRMVLLEEGSELGASLMFLLAALIYAHRAGMPASSARALGEIRVVVPAHMLRLASRLVPLALLAGLMVAAVTHLAYAAKPYLGDPLPWFSAIAALLAAAAAWLLPGSSHPAGARLVLAALCLMWSLDQGAGFLFTDNIWTGSPRAELATRLAMAAVTLAGMAYVLRGPLTPLLRRRVIAWGVLLAVAPLTGHPIGIAALVFGGCAVLLMGIVDERVADTGSLRSAGLG